MQQVWEKEVTARKLHSCDLCNKTIFVGQKYNSSFVVDGGDSWMFKCHLNCRYIMDELYYFFDPEEGVHEGHFTEYLSEYCREFVCPHCTNYKQDENGDMYCQEDNNAGTDCILWIVDRLREYKIKQYKDEKRPWVMAWREVERED